VKKFISKRRAAFGFAFKGIYLLVKYEAHARIHLVASILVIAAGFYFQITKTEWLAILLAISSVFAAEGFNSAIERLTNKSFDGIHPQAAAIKDLAAGAVLICAIVAAIIGLIIFTPYLLMFWQL
jgi:diacylglycerol kinase (ATP)